MTPAAETALELTHAAIDAFCEAAVAVAFLTAEERASMAGSFVGPFGTSLLESADETRNYTRDEMFATLDVAVENGYNLLAWSAERIAADVAEYDSQFEGIDPLRLTPFVAEWLAARGIR